MTSGAEKGPKTALRGSQGESMLKCKLQAWRQGERHRMGKRKIQVGSHKIGYVSSSKPRGRSLYIIIFTAISVDRSVKQRLAAGAIAGLLFHQHFAAAFYGNEQPSRKFRRCLAALIGHRPLETIGLSASEDLRKFPVDQAAVFRQEKPNAGAGHRPADGCGGQGWVHIIMDERQFLGPGRCRYVFDMDWELCL